MTKLSVNLNKVALIRNSRGRNDPSLIAFGEMALKAGADGLTIHPRPDQRHARYDDICELKSLCESYDAELNVEGYPTETLINHCIKNMVHQVTLVPDLPNQITSDHGWDISSNTELLQKVLAELKAVGIRSSLFMDCDDREISLAHEVGADRIELHTESYARSFEKNTHNEHVLKYIQAYETALNCGLRVNAGHDLNQNNLGFFLQKIPVDEVSIGHALTVESLILGWEKTITLYKSICSN